MSTRLYRPVRDDITTDGAEVLKDHAHDVAVNQLLPRIARRNQIAVETIQTRFYLFHRLLVGQGRQCSCFNVEISPSTLCRACYGTGVVGGYRKYGTNLAVFDVTHPELRTINVIPDYNVQTRPRHFILMEGARQGSVTARIYLETTTGTVDKIYAQSQANAGTSIAAFVRAPSETGFVPFTKEALEQRLFNPWVDIKVQLERGSIDTVSPRFCMIYVRYQRFEDNIIMGNTPPREQSSLFSELGLTDEWNMQSFWLDNKAKYVGEQDLLFDLDSDHRWKITQISPSDPQFKLLSWDVQARLLRIDDPEVHLPL